MKQVMLSLFLLCSLFANSQTQPDTTKPEVKIKLELTVGQADRILQALSALPYKDVADVIAAIYTQAQKQLVKEIPQKEKPKN